MSDLQPLPPSETPSSGMGHLLKTRRFLPLFVTQFITSFNDNFFKNAFVALITYGIFSQSFGEDEQNSYILWATALFIIPFFLFSATAGVLADRFEKTTVVKGVKIAEIVIMLLGAYGFWTDNIPVLLAIVFLMGTHSAFFSPIKYGILPAYLQKIELVAGNALIEAATFIAIVIGTILGTQIILIEGTGDHWTAFVMIAFAIIGYISCFFMPKAPPHPDAVKQPFSWNLISHNVTILKTLRGNSELLIYVMASTWFWFVAATLMTLFPMYVKDVLNMNKDVYTFLLSLFSIGVGVGSALCSVLLKGKISARYAPLAAMVMGILVFDVGMNAGALFMDEGHGTLQHFFSHTSWIRITFDMLFIALAGGMYAVPFFALLQDRAGEGEKSKIFAANNIINSAGMVGSVGFTAVLKMMGFSIPDIFMTVGVLCILGAFGVHAITPDSFFRRKSG